MTSEHYRTDRQEREEIIRQIGQGNVIGEYTIDKGHKNGPELHKVTDTAIILIYNKRTGKLITKLIARPNQITRYGITNTAIINLAKEHQKMGYNKK